MPEVWTGAVVGDMHLHRISAATLADKLGWHPKYLSQVLNGRVAPKNAEAKVSAALMDLIKAKAENSE